MTRAPLDEIVDRSVSLEELRHALNEPIPAEERDDILSLRRWFTTRYADAGARLAYVRQAHARWMSTSESPPTDSRDPSKSVAQP